MIESPSRRGAVDSSIPRTTIIAGLDGPGSHVLGKSRPEPAPRRSPRAIQSLGASPERLNICPGRVSQPLFSSVYCVDAPLDDPHRASGTGLPCFCQAWPQRRDDSHGDGLGGEMISRGVWAVWRVPLPEHGILHELSRATKENAESNKSEQMDVFWPFSGSGQLVTGDGS